MASGDYAALTLWQTEFELLASIGIEFNFVTIKPRYVGSWFDDIRSIGDKTGYSPDAIIGLNPWLMTNSFRQNNHDYVMILVPNVKAKSIRGTGNSGGYCGYESFSWGDGGGIIPTPDVPYTPPSGDDTTKKDEPDVGDWYFPLGSGNWYVSQGYHLGHTGIDLSRNAGTPIYASLSGTVVQSYYSTSWGYTVLIKHDDDLEDTETSCYYTRYAHMAAASSYTVGQHISKGAQLGNVGNTGKSTGAHLHYHIYYTLRSRTDYANFNGSALFGVNPNNIQQFPSHGSILTGNVVKIS